MPLKHNLTKYDKLRERVHKTSAKNACDYTEEDRKVYDMAVLVAAFSSSKSWNTHREIAESRSPNFAQESTHEEYAIASSEKWKTVSSFDISEVMQKNISDFKFEHWLYYNVPGKLHDEYKSAWLELNDLIGKDDGIEEMNDIV